MEGVKPKESFCAAGVAARAVMSHVGGASSLSRGPSLSPQQQAVYECDGPAPRCAAAAGVVGAAQEPAFRVGVLKRNGCLSRRLRVQFAEGVKAGDDSWLLKSHSSPDYGLEEKAPLGAPRTCSAIPLSPAFGPSAHSIATGASNEDSAGAMPTMPMECTHDVYPQWQQNLLSAGGCDEVRAATLVKLLGEEPIKLGTPSIVPVVPEEPMLLAAELAKAAAGMHSSAKPLELENAVETDGAVAAFTSADEIVEAAEVLITKPLRVQFATSVEKEHEVKTDTIDAATAGGTSSSERKKDARDGRGTDADGKSGRVDTEDAAPEVSTPPKAEHSPSKSGVSSPLPEEEECFEADYETHAGAEAAVSPSHSKRRRVRASAWWLNTQTAYERMAVQRAIEIARSGRTSNAGSGDARHGMTSNIASKRLYAEPTPERRKRGKR